MMFRDSLILPVAAFEVANGKFHSLKQGLGSEVTCARDDSGSRKGAAGLKRI